MTKKEERKAYELKMWLECEGLSKSNCRPEGVVDPPLKSIRKHCLSCVNGSPHEVELCPACDCWLYPHRFGKKAYSIPTRALTLNQRLNLAKGWKAAGIIGLKKEGKLEG